MTAGEIGCAPATVYRSDDRPLTGVIEGSDATTLRVRDKEGNRFALGQSQVAEIDHPGNVGAIIGLVIAAIGVAIVVPTYQGDAWRSSFPGQRGLGYAYIAIGGVNVALCSELWIRSRLAARSFNQARPTPPPAAAVFPDPPGLR